MLTQRLRTFPLFLFSIALLCSPFLARTAAAQPFYTFTMETGEYKDLVGATPLVKPEMTALIDTVFALDFGGEAFKLYGQEFRCDENTPLIIYGGGFIRFDNANGAVVIDGFLSFLEYFDETSQVGYLLDQNEEEKILKVEWKKLALIDSPDVAGDYLSFQVWVYQQSGRVEMRYGPRNLAADSGVLLGGGPYVGIFRFAPDPFQIYEKNWLVGNPFNPVYETTGNNFSLLEGCPREGTVFRMTPRISSGVDDPGKESLQDGVGAYRLFPNPTNGRVTLQAAKPLEKGVQVRVTDVLGRTVSETEMAHFASALDLDLPAPGLYYCQVTGDEGTQIYSVVRQ